MDRLAREGVRFANAFATTPLCSPSRASLLTGQYARTHGIIDNTARPSHDLPMFPLELQRAGYTTGFFGKWHMGNDDSPRPGFNRWVAMPGQGEASIRTSTSTGSACRRRATSPTCSPTTSTIHSSAGRKPFLVVSRAQGDPSEHRPAERRQPRAECRASRAASSPPIGIVAVTRAGRCRGGRTRSSRRSTSRR